MKIRQSLRYRLHRQGVTMVELLTAMALGLIVVAVALNAYSIMTRQTRLLDAINMVQRDGTMAIQLLQSMIRSAGFSSPSTYDAEQGWLLRVNDVALSGCDGGNDSGRAATKSTPSPGRCRADARSDELMVTTELDAVSTALRYDGAVVHATDCLGQRINHLVSPPQSSISRMGWRSTARLFISNKYELSCAGPGNSAAQPMVDNIESMQIQYGVVGAGAASSLSSFTDVNASALTDPSAWRAIRTVSICLVARSKDPLVELSPQRPYQDCVGQTLTATDQRWRQTFRTVIVLSNPTHHVHLMPPAGEAP